ncbi:MAG: protein kinase [Planctomycetota bacterium]
MDRGEALVDAGRWIEVEEILKQVLRLPPAERSRFLAQRCVASDEVLRDVESLLQHDFEGDESLPGETLRRSCGAAPLAVGDHFGSYRILGVLGSGGMGVVYLAEQRSPRRRVALKLIAPGRSSPQAVRRFGLESEALGKLDHPAIARIFESGTEDVDGVCCPFIAMEYIDGMTLREHLAQRVVPLGDRVRLAATICEAVQHAHANGVVHRDLKPQNILIDALGQPHIVDFGLARLLGEDQAPRTETGCLMGTVSYMSPEQCRGDPGRIDSRTDVYSLGVILYEVLAGSGPFESRGASLAETVRRICETSPVPLSAVNPECRGDLDIVVLHALEKDPDQRYATAAELAGDLRRWLSHEPISVRGVSSFYRVSRWARRHRGRVAAGIAIVGATAWMGVVSWIAQLDRMQQQEESLSFLNSLLAPRPTWQREMSYVDLLKLVGPEIDRLPVADGRIRATLHERLGVAFWALTQYDEARKHLGFAYELSREGGSRSELTTLRVANILGDVLKEAGDFAAAEALAREWLDRNRRSSFSDHESAIRFATNLGDALAARGERDAALTCYREVVDQARRILDQSHPDRAEVINSLARLLLDREEWGEGAALAREALDLQLAAQGASNPGTLRAQTTLGRGLLGLGLVDEATWHLETADATLRATLGSRCLDSLEARTHLARLRRIQGRDADADAMLRGVSLDAERMFPPESWQRLRYRDVASTQSSGGSSWAQPTAGRREAE